MKINKINSHLFYLFNNYASYKKKAIIKKIFFVK